MDGISCNPYLPLYEYIPDGEPRVFNDRLYVYGSHDQAGGDFFCLGDYVVWSAPLSDLSDWKCEGVSYRRDQDPHNADGKWELFAPDVVQASDGRYYLYYCLRMQKEVGVAVSDSPAGPFEFYGHVCHPDGSLLCEDMPYDPAVLVDDDGRVYLYYGYTSETISAKFNASASPGGMVAELEPDMKTVKAAPVICVPRDIHTAGTGFEGHGYYEAPSIRKIDGRYYLVYSSEVCHELCYAVSDSPTEGYVYGGVLVSNGDIGMNGRTEPVCMPGNNHGGLVCVEGQYFIFYQRHTQCTQYSRQGCAEPVEMLPDGSILQAEITSAGLNCGPLPARDSWPAAYACHLTCAEPMRMMDYRNADPNDFPAIWEDGTSEEETEKEQYIRNLTDGCTFGFKYFRAKQVTSVTLTLRGHAKGRVTVRLDDPEKGTVLGSLEVDTDKDEWQQVRMETEWSGTNALYLSYKGTGSFDVRDLSFEEKG